MRTAVYAALAVLALAGAARAQAPTRAEDAIVRFTAEAAPTPVFKAKTEAAALSAPDLFLKSAADRESPVRPKGTVQTAIDHSFSRSRGVVGSVGYLCGLASGPNEAGGVASSHEPMSTFLGGQLHVAF